MLKKSDRMKKKKCSQMKINDCEEVKSKKKNEG